VSIKEIAVFSMLGSVMFVSKIVMEALPNIHLLGALTMTYTLVFRKKALIPIYIYIFLNGLFAGFSAWWVPYLYIWTLLWGITMLLPKKIPKKFKCIIYPLVCSFHGLFYGILYSPAEALMFGLDFEGTVAWIIAGIPFDLIHALGNLLAGILIVPLSDLLFKLTGTLKG
jgi:energy-coupling factor transport system substrate-specific component